MYPTGKVASVRPPSTAATRTAYDQAATLLDLAVRLRDLAAVDAYAALGTPQELPKAALLLSCQKAAEEHLEDTIGALHRHTDAVATSDVTEETWAHTWKQRGDAHLGRIAQLSGKASQRLSSHGTSRRPTELDDIADTLVIAAVSRVTDRFRSVRAAKAAGTLEAR